MFTERLDGKEFGSYRVLRRLGAGGLVLSLTRAFYE